MIMTTFKTVRTDLSDVTFLIPLRVDSSEREENTFALIQYLIKHFITSIIVLESDLTRKLFPCYESDQIRYEFIEDSNEFFHKTKCITKLIHMADTKYVAVWDTDVIVPVSQIVSSVEKLRTEQAFLTLPYDGRAFLTDKYYAELFKTTLEIRVFMKLLPGMPLMYGYHSTGGAFLTNKAKYLETGGENEKFCGWGPEDAERLKRIEIMKLSVQYCSGPLFHLWHPRGKTSQYASKKNEIQNRKEFIETCRKRGLN
jgi:predicted glycosyltransferase involved in capsule biosynthesis